MAITLKQYAAIIASICLLFVLLLCEANAGPRRVYRGTARNIDGTPMAGAVVRVIDATYGTFATVYESPRSLEKKSSLRSGKDGDYEVYIDSFEYSYWHPFTIAVENFAGARHVHGPLAIKDYYIGDYPVTASLRVPGSIDMGLLPPGLTFTVDAGVLLEIDGVFEAGRQTLFKGQGLVRFGEGATFDILPEWFGGSLREAVKATTSRRRAIRINGRATIEEDITIPENVMVRIGDSGYVVSAGGRLNIQGPFEAPLREVFVGFDVGDVTFGMATADVTRDLNVPDLNRPRTGTIREVFPQWWGASEDGTGPAVKRTTRAVNSAISSLNPARARPMKNGKYLMDLGPGGTVRILGQLPLDDSIRLKPKVTLAGSGASIIMGVHKSYSASQSVLRCMQRNGEDCVVVTPDIDLLDPLTCEPKKGYSSLQYALTKPAGVVIKGLDIVGDQTMGAKNGHGLVIGDYPRSASSDVAYCVKAYPKPKPFATDSAYDSEIIGNRIWYHGKFGIRIGNAATVRIINNYVGQNKWSGIYAFRVTNGHVIQGNHFQGNCIDPRGHPAGGCYSLNLIHPYGVSVIGNTLEDGWWVPHKAALVRIAHGQGVVYSGNYHEIAGTPGVENDKVGLVIFGGNSNTHVHGNFFQILTDEKTRQCSAVQISPDNEKQYLPKDIVVEANGSLGDRNDPKRTCRTLVRVTGPTLRLKLSHNSLMLDDYRTAHSRADYIYAGLGYVQDLAVEPDDKRVQMSFARASLTESVLNIVSAAGRLSSLSQLVRALWLFDDYGLSRARPFASEGGNLRFKVRQPRQIASSAFANLPAPLGLGAFLEFDENRVFEGGGGADLSDGNSSGFSVMVLVRPRKMMSQDITLASENNQKAGQGGPIWWLSIRRLLGGSRLSLQIYDRDGASFMERHYAQDLSESDVDSWHTYAATYSGGSLPSSIQLFRDGLEVDGYRGAGRIVRMGGSSSSIRSYLVGSQDAVVAPMIGSCAFVLVAAVELSEHQISRIDRLLRAYFGLGD